MTNLLLHHRLFQRFALAFLVTRAGDFMLSVGMVVFVFRETGSAAWVGIAATMRIVPHTLLSGPGGALGGRLGLRYLVASDLARAAINVALTVAAVAGSLPGVLAASVLAQVAGAGYFATCSGLMPQLVGAERTAEATAAMSAVDSVSLLAGPAVAGAMLAVLPPSVAFGLNALSFLVCACVVATLRLPAAPVRAPEAGDAQPVTLGARAAIRTLATDAHLRAAAAATLGGGVVIGMVSVVFVVLSSRVLGTGDSGAGYLLAAYGAGGVVGAVVAARVDSTRGRSWAPVLLLLVGASTAALVITGWAPLAWLVAAVVGAGTGVVEVLGVTAAQLARPDDAAALCGAMDSIGYGAVLVGLVGSPLLLAAVGVQGCLVVVGLLCALLAVGARMGRSRQPRHRAVRTTWRTAAPVG